MTAAGRALLRVAWISDSAPAGLSCDGAYFERHRQAALRFRVGIPARALHPLGVESAFIGLDTPAVLAHLTPERFDAVVFAKLSTPRGPTYEAFTTAYLGTAGHARARGLAVVVDLVDNVFATDRCDFFRALIDGASAVTVASAALAEICRTQTGAQVTVIDDPVEGERRAPRFEPPGTTLLARLARGTAAPRRLRLLWFGGQYRSFLDLAALFPALQAFAATQPVELEVVTGADERVARALAALQADGSPALVARFTEWSLEALEAALDRCDLVLLPANLDDAMRAAASANRLARALWAGRPVVAHPLASYRDFSDAAWLGRDVVAGVRWALAHPREVRDRIAAGQARLSRQYDPAAIAARWRAAIEAALPPAAR